MAYISSFKDQNWLIPHSINDMIPEDHICFFVEEFVESLNFNGFEMINEGVGHPSYHPRIIMKILLQGMISKERSSRKLANACRENFVFMYLAEKVQPNFRTICRFRENNSKFIREVFKETINLASKHNLIDLNVICTDGTKIKANASSKRFLDAEQIDRLDSIIDSMIEEDIKKDKIDMENNLREENLTNLDSKNLKEIVKEYKKSTNKEMLKKRCNEAKEEASNLSDNKRVSITDPDCRIMLNKKGKTEPAYNAQLTVDSKNQIILANDACKDPTDINQLEPQVKMTKENIELKKDTKIAADCGYNNGKNYMVLEREELIGYIPNQEQVQEMYERRKKVKQDDYECDFEKDEIIINGERYRFYGMWKKKKNSKERCYKAESGKIKRVPEFFRERLRMKERMKSIDGRMIYNIRKQVIEPVIGNIKYNLGLQEFSMRGLDSAKLELNLVCIAHNIKKIWKSIREINSINKNISFYLIIKHNQIYCDTACNKG